MDKLKTRVLPKYIYAKHTTGEGVVNGTSVVYELIIPIGLGNKVFIKVDASSSLFGGYESIGSSIPLVLPIDIEKEDGIGILIRLNNP